MAKRHLLMYTQKIRDPTFRLPKGGKVIDLKSIPTAKEDLDHYEVENLFHSWSFQPSASPMRVVSAKGIRFKNESGREFLDFSSCFVSHNIGHQDPRVLEALIEQANTLCSFAPVLSTKPRAHLAKLMAEITPGDLSRTFFSLGGTEANEAAIKICHQYTGRRKIISRYNSYHGGTAAPMALSAGDPRNWAQVPGGAERVSAPSPSYLNPLRAPTASSFRLTNTSRG